MFEPQYPNLELLEYKAQYALLEHPHFLAKLDEAKKKQMYARLYLDAYVFPQIWGSTATGFDVTKDGFPTIGGCAMTKAYTVVFHDATISDSYVVFFGGRMCYLVTEPNEAFLSDFRQKKLGSLSFALKNY